jgi:hypothetical protein
MEIKKVKNVDIVNSDYDVLKGRFFTIIRYLEDDKIKAIGDFLVTEVEPKMSIQAFAKLIKDEKDSKGYSYSALIQYRNIYKRLSQETGTGISKEKLEIISQVEDNEVKTKLLETANDTSREALRDQVNYFLENKELPKDEVKSELEMSLKYNGAVLKLISEMRLLRKSLYQVRKERLFDGFTLRQKEKFYTHLDTVQKEYTALIEEIIENKKYLGDKNGSRRS